jgi:hypothetical protein
MAETKAAKAAKEKAAEKAEAKAEAKELQAEEAAKPWDGSGPNPYIENDPAEKTQKRDLID